MTRSAPFSAQTYYSLYCNLHDPTFRLWTYCYSNYCIATGAKAAQATLIRRLTALPRELESRCPDIDSRFDRGGAQVRARRLRPKFRTGDNQQDGTWILARAHIAMPPPRVAFSTPASRQTNSLCATFHLPLTQAQHCSLTFTRSVVRPRAGMITLRGTRLTEGFVKNILEGEELGYETVQVR